MKKFIILSFILSFASGVPCWAVDRFKGVRKPCDRPLAIPPCQPETISPPETPGQSPSSSSMAQPSTSSSFQEALASASEAGSQPPSSYHPGFFGDLIGVGTITPIGIFDPPYYVNQVNGLSIGVAQASAIKVAESDSPRPVDRVYYFYNFYGNIDPTLDPMAFSFPLLQMHRHVIGFEKTLLTGRASVGMRVPFFRFAGDFNYQTSFVGDLSILTKFMLIENPETRSLFSIGFAISAPTGSTPAFLQGPFVPPFTRERSPRNYPVYLQPWGGYIYNLTSRFYIHGFHSVLVSTDTREPSFVANDIGAGLWLYRNANAPLIRGIVPTVEIHVNSPMTRRGMPQQAGEVRMRDSVNLTSGFYVMMTRSILGGAVGVPLAFGPHTIEAVANYTLRF